LKRILSTSVLLFLFFTAGNAQAWWQTPYGAYWPNAWPSTNMQRGYNPYAVQPWGYNSPDWKMRGYINQQGDVHVEFKYRGNINNDFFGGYGGYPGYGTYQRPSYYGWR